MAWGVLPARPRAGARARTGSRILPTIEINGSFYALQRPASYAAWYDATPPGFVFAVKGNRFLTHMLKLRGIETPLANVLASGVFALREKLGPFLWQFPPQLRFDADKVEHFLSLPRASARGRRMGMWSATSTTTSRCGRRSMRSG